MRTRNELAAMLAGYTDNYGKFVEWIGKRIEELQTNGPESVAEVDCAELSAGERRTIAEKLVASGKLNFLFSTKPSRETQERLERVLLEAIRETLGEGRLKFGKLHKNEKVAWLRENEKKLGTYSEYRLGNGYYTLYVKAGLNQRSYKLWTEGSANYVETYYRHMKSLKPHDFLPHNDKRFSWLTSHFLNGHADMRTYLELRERVWMSLLKRDVSWERDPIAALLAFAYAFNYKKSVDSNSLLLDVGKEEETVSLRLVGHVVLTKEQFAALLSRYDASAVPLSEFEVWFAVGQTCVVGASDDSASVKGANSFCQLLDSFNGSKETIARYMRRHHALVAVELEDEQLFRLFVELLESIVQQQFEALCDSQESMQEDFVTLASKIEKLRADSESLDNAELRREYRVVTAMRAQLVDWYKTIDARLRESITETERAEVLNRRDL